VDKFHKFMIERDGYWTLGLTFSLIFQHFLQILKSTLKKKLLISRYILSVSSLMLYFLSISRRMASDIKENRKLARWDKMDNFHRNKYVCVLKYLLYDILVKCNVQWLWNGGWNYNAKTQHYLSKCFIECQSISRIYLGGPGKKLR
jgi:hypothetical protein